MPDLPCDGSWAAPATVSAGLAAAPRLTTGKLQRCSHPVASQSPVAPLRPAGLKTSYLLGLGIPTGKRTGLRMLEIFPCWVERG